MHAFLETPLVSEMSMIFQCSVKHKLKSRRYNLKRLNLKEVERDRHGFQKTQDGQSPSALTFSNVCLFALAEKGHSKMQSGS